MELENKHLFRLEEEAERAESAGLGRLPSAAVTEGHKSEESEADGSRGAHHYVSRKMTHNSLLQVGEGGGGRGGARDRHQGDLCPGSDRCQRGTLMTHSRGSWKRRVYFIVRGRETRLLEHNQHLGKIFANQDIKRC